MKKMTVNPAFNMPQVSWEHVAAQKQERLRTGGEGETFKQMVDTVLPVLYDGAGGTTRVQYDRPQKLDLFV